ncbi:hypothetical protein [Salininema proteolyticum]|uniref:Uncharacterized protein n=1 Tax=Salininema proteolyticum TaxID=1607685 RepID=A0ABV8TTV4_9ACTN
MADSTFITYKGQKFEVSVLRPEEDLTMVSVLTTDYRFALSIDFEGQELPTTTYGLAIKNRSRAWREGLRREAIVAAQLNSHP